MKPKKLVLVAVTLAVSLFAGSASAQQSRMALDADIALCGTQVFELNAKIAACTRAIKSDALTPQQLSAVHVSRGGLLVMKGDAKAAIADLDPVIQAAPRNADALVTRGAAWALLGNNDKASVDFDAAIAVNPAMIEAWYESGLAR